jgi:rhamnose utilization protein RhaD (predicted bifunctional aldolase and dehydrogenase)/NAD(P)-dependent dehydrogenase (short-subunit alcohol dehydrogenase family)
MKSLWNPREARQFPGLLGQRVYTSRLLGRDKSLVLHGGGNTSVKIEETNLVGDTESLLYVKGSGWDLEHIEPAGFAPVRLDPLLRLAQLDRLTDPQMVNELRAHTARATAPAPSVETILHALLPHRYVDHTHADAVLSITNTVDGRARIEDTYGDRVVVIPYVMPGFDLARCCAREFPKQCGPRTIGMVLLKHGVFSFGADAREAYERMIELVDAAERHLARHRAWRLPRARARIEHPDLRVPVAALRKDISRIAGRPMIVASHRDARALAFVRRPDVARVAVRGPATPDHVLRTKRIAMIGRNVDAYARAYRAYFDAHAPRAADAKTMLDPAPRVALDPALGFLAIGASARDAAIVEDLYRHTMDVIERSERLGGFRALPARDIFDVEYWDLEQAKLRSAGKPPLLAGEVVLVTGAASGIGKACVAALLGRGAAVVAVDRDPGVAALYRRPDFLGIRGDVTSAADRRDVLVRTVQRYGGLDAIVLNAGVFPGGTPIASLGDAAWRGVMQVNVDANLAWLRETHCLLRLAPRGGRVAVIGSKNVPAPGIGAAAYSASKAALVQLARVAALEWAPDGIRVNIVHPDAVFDTGLWTDAVLAERARHYGMSVEQYKRRNLLRTELSSRDVAELAAELCGPLFAKTTGAQIPVDGGNDRVV